MLWDMKVLYYLISTIENSIFEPLITPIFWLKMDPKLHFAVIMAQLSYQTHGNCCIKANSYNPLGYNVNIVMRLYPTTGILGNLTPYLGPNICL